MPVEPKRATVSRKANDMKNYAVPVLRMRENLPTPQHRTGTTGLGTHNSLRAAAIAMTVTPRLTQGPQSAVPTIIAIAKSGKNALPKTRPVCDKNLCDTPPDGRRFMTTSIRDSRRECCPQLYSFEKNSNSLHDWLNKNRPVDLRRSRGHASEHIAVFLGCRVIGMLGAK